MAYPTFPPSSYWWGSSFLFPFVDRWLDIFAKEKTFLLCSDDKIIWIVGHRIDDRFRITTKTKKTYIANLLDI